MLSPGKGRSHSKGIVGQLACLIQPEQYGSHDSQGKNRQTDARSRLELSKVHACVHALRNACHAVLTLLACTVTADC